MGHQHVSFQLPSEVIEAIEAEAKRTGQSETAIVLTILTQAFVDSNPTSSTIQLEHLQQQLNDLRVEIYRLSEQLQERFLMRLDSGLRAAIRSLPIEERSAWMTRVLIEARQMELMQQAITLNGSANFPGFYFPRSGQRHSQN